MWKVVSLPMLLFGLTSVCSLVQPHISCNISHIFDKADCEMCGTFVRIETANSTLHSSLAMTKTIRLASLSADEFACCVDMAGSCDRF